MSLDIVFSHEGDFLSKILINKQINYGESCFLFTNKIFY